MKSSRSMAKKFYSPLCHCLCRRSREQQAGCSQSTFTIKRGNAQFDRTLLAVKPLSPTNSDPSFGILSWQGDTKSCSFIPIRWNRSSDSVAQIFGTIGALFAPKSEIGVQQLGGAVMIIRVYSNLVSK